MKKMLEAQFPGIDVILDNYPPSLSKSFLSKVVLVFEFRVLWIKMVGEQIFPMIGIMTPPLWYYSLRANNFGSIITAWLLGNVGKASWIPSREILIGFKQPTGLRPLIRVGFFRMQGYWGFELRTRVSQLDN
ncbi:hypothetical protein Golax_005253 [Gossypium laxum]|uniref:Uncharacterized protein n=1 Tax=Gossypium laxum TaxID=34288 RepID=A0A7J9A1J2_9ROSI|nr:hypothetical protein [Gossypium laxum]